MIYLSDAARDCLARLAATQPVGPLFRNTDGHPWKAQAVVCRFQRLLVKFNAPELPVIKRFEGRTIKDPTARAAAKAAHQVLKTENRKQRGTLAREHPRRFAMYDIRHCFATRKLKEGHDPITVAALLGHRDATMLCKHYQELSGDADHLRAAANGAKSN